MTQTEPAPNNPLGHSAAAKSIRENRREQVAVLLLARVPYRQIADRVGVAYSTVRSDVAVIQGQWRARYAAVYGEHVAEMTAVLDALQRAWLPKALGAAPDSDAAAQMRWILRERARLHGTDAPVKVRHEVLTEGLVDAAIIELTEQLAGRSPIGETAPAS